MNVQVARCSRGTTADHLMSSSALSERFRFRRSIPQKAARFVTCDIDLKSELSAMPALSSTDATLTDVVTSNVPHHEERHLDSPALFELPSQAPQDRNGKCSTRDTTASNQHQGEDSADEISVRSLSLCSSTNQPSMSC